MDQSGYFTYPRLFGFCFVSKVIKNKSILDRLYQKWRTVLNLRRKGFSTINAKRLFLLRNSVSVSAPTQEYFIVTLSQKGGGDTGNRAKRILLW
jgi:hypothetical protein